MNKAKTTFKNIEDAITKYTKEIEALESSIEAKRGIINRVKEKQEDFLNKKEEDIKKTDEYNKLKQKYNRVKERLNSIEKTSNNLDKLWEKTTTGIISSKTFLGEQDTRYRTVKYYLYQHGIGTQDTYVNKINGRLGLNGFLALPEEYINKAIDKLDETRGNENSIIFKEFSKLKNVKSDIFVFNSNTFGEKYEPQNSKIEYIKPYGFDSYGFDSIKIKIIEGENEPLTYSQTIEIDLETIIEYGSLDEMKKFLRYYDDIIEYLTYIETKANKCDIDKISVEIQEGLKSYIIQDEMKEMII